MFVASHKYQKFPAQEPLSSAVASSSGTASASRVASSSHSAFSSQTSSVSLYSSSSATSLNVDVAEKSFVPRQKLLMMTIDDKMVSAAADI